MASAKGNQAQAGNGGASKRSNPSARLEEEEGHGYAKKRSRSNEDDDDDDDDRNEYEDGSINGSHKQKRSRVHYSCSECHRRKQKCDRKTPCNHCIARKIPERCKTFQPGEETHDLASRLGKLESTINRKFDHIMTMLQGSIGSANPATGIAAWRTGVPQPQSIQNGPSKSDQPEGSEAGDDVLVYNDDSHAIASSMRRTNFDSRIDTLLTNVKQQKANKMGDALLLTDTDPKQGLNPSDQLDAVMYEYGATYGVSQVLLSNLPSRALCDVAIDEFFSVNWLRQTINRKTVMRNYDEFWRSGARLTVNNLNSYAVYLLLIALGLLSYRGPLQVSQDSREIRRTAKGLYFTARHCLLVGQMLGNEDLDKVLAFILAARYLFIDRRVSEAWSCLSNATKVAHSIGLHRDGAALGLPKAVSIERRRIWNLLYCNERYVCMNLGRPTGIDDNVVDSVMPDDKEGEEDFVEYTTIAPTVAIPKGEKPRLTTFAYFREKLAKIVGQVVNIYQRIHEQAHYSDVLKIDHQISDLLRSLPDHLRSEFDKDGNIRHINQEWDDALTFVSVHRYMLQIEILFVRMSLHRPYLIVPQSTHPEKQAKKGSSRTSNGRHASRYQFSKRSCIEAAYQSLVLRQDILTKIRQEVATAQLAPTWVSLLGTYNTFSAIVILGISILMDPKADNVDRLLKVLLSFERMYTRKRHHGSEEIKERELATIRMFLKRIEEKRSGNKEGEADKSVPASRQNNPTEDVGRRTSSRGARAPSNEAGDSQSGAGNRQLAREPSYIDFALASSAATSLQKPGQAAGVGNVLSQADSEQQSLPWPYLPLNTPYLTTTSDPMALHGGRSSKGTPNSDQEPNSAGRNQSSANQRTQSEQTLTPYTNSPSDDLQGASVHQLIDSWFRSNAFQNSDLDGDLGAILASDPNGQLLPQSTESGSQVDVGRKTADLNSTGPNVGNALDPVARSGSTDDRANDSQPYGYGSSDHLLGSVAQQMHRYPALADSSPAIFSTGTDASTSWNTTTRPAFGRAPSAANDPSKNLSNSDVSQYHAPSYSNVDTRSSPAKAQSNETSELPGSTTATVSMTPSESMMNDSIFWQSLMDRIAR